jgi:L-ascorbate metabolism protein UlaG (beta-lactamase superfamily)
MSEDKYYLKANVLLEPLVDQWYAWPHLIPPATAARNITERHLRIMDSYITAQAAHAEAVKNPKMLGGPFMDYDGNRVDEVKALRDRTVTKRPHLIALSKAIGELDALLRDQAKGFSLQPLYAQVPEPLQGYVELVYDLNNQPGFRLLEPLLYHSPYYDRSMQSLCLSEISKDDRPFVLSTPRIPGRECLQLQLPFDHAGIDALFRLRRQASSFRSVKEAVELPDEHDAWFQSFLTREPPPPYRNYEGPAARWRYFGHACILFETRDTRILLDPVLSYTYENSISRYTYEDLPDVIDFVLITHNHQDHILFETLLQIRHRIGTVVVPRNGSGALQDPSLKLLFQNCGFKNVIEMSELDQIDFPTGSITAIPFLGEHADLDVRTKLAYVVKINGHSLLFAADSCNISPKVYEHLHPLIGDVEVLFVGMECDGAPLSWIYGPLLTQKLDRVMDRSRRLAGSDYDKAIDIVNRFHCREVYVYAMGQEPWLNYVMSLKYTEQSNPIIQSNRLLKTCAERGIVAERLFGEKEIFLS